jgi:hypothetical protein
MKMFSDEAALVTVLDEADVLIAQASAGSVPLRDFVQRLWDLYGTHALDGHESDQQERAVLGRHARRIEFIYRILQELGGLCSEEDAVKRSYIEAGRFGVGEGLRRLNAVIASQRP